MSGVTPPHRTWGSCLWDAAGVEGPSPGPARHPLAQTLARSLVATGTSSRDQETPCVKPGLRRGMCFGPPHLFKIPSAGDASRWCPLRPHSVTAASWVNAQVPFSWEQQRHGEQVACFPGCGRVRWWTCDWEGKPGASGYTRAWGSPVVLTHYLYIYITCTQMCTQRKYRHHTHVHTAHMLTRMHMFSSHTHTMYTHHTATRSHDTCVNTHHVHSCMHVRTRSSAHAHVHVNTHVTFTHARIYVYTHHPHFSFSRPHCERACIDSFIRSLRHTLSAHPASREARGSAYLWAWHVAGAQ